MYPMGGGGIPNYGAELFLLADSTCTPCFSRYIPALDLQIYMVVIRRHGRITYLNANFIRNSNH